MADDQTAEKAFVAFRTHLHDLPAGMNPRITQEPINSADPEIVEPIRVWLDKAYALIERCGPWIKAPPVGRGLDSAWLRRLAQELGKVQEGSRQYRSLSDYLWHANSENLGHRLQPYAEASYQVAEFRSEHTPGGVIGLLEDEAPNVWAQLRKLSAECEQQWIDSGLPPRRGPGVIRLVTHHTTAQNELENRLQKYHIDFGKLLLRATDDLLIPDELRKQVGFADAIYETFRGGLTTPSVLFDRLCAEWLPTAKDGYGGPRFDYPSAEKDDQQRFNEGVRVARCAAALADALEPEVVGSEQEPQPTTLSLAEDASPGTVLARLERFQLLMDGANASDSIRETRAKGNEPTADVAQAAEIWTGGETQAELCALASVLSEEAEFYQCAEGGRCLALVGLNYWQCLRRREPINAYTIRQTLAELWSKLRAAIRREADGSDAVASVAAGIEGGENQNSDSEASVDLKREPPSDTPNRSDTPALDGLIRNFISAPVMMERCLERDARAIDILTSDLPLHRIVLPRLEQIYWGRKARERNGKTVRFPRGWTRRDEQLANLLRGFGPGNWPDRRASRFYRRLRPRMGLPLHEAWFQQALDEARRQGTAVALTPKLDAAREAFDKLLEIARHAIDLEATSSEYIAGQVELGQLVCDLMPCASPQVRSIEQPNAYPVTSVSGGSAPLKSPSKAPEISQTIAEIEQLTPALSVPSDDWLKAADPKMRNEATTNSLKSLRNAMKDGAQKSEDGLFGVDKAGRRWRKDSAASTTVWYWRGTLKGKHRLRANDG